MSDAPARTEVIDDNRVNALIDQLQDFMQKKGWLVSSESLMALLTVAAELSIVHAARPMPKPAFVKQAELCWEMVKASTALPEPELS